MKRFRILLLAALCALGLFAAAGTTTAAATPASSVVTVVAVPAATSSTTGWAQACYPKVGTYASLLVKNRLLSNGYQRYEFTVKGDTGPLVDIYINKVWFDGVLIFDPDRARTASITFIRDFKDRTSKHTVKFEAYQASLLDDCTVGPR